RAGRDRANFDSTLVSRFAAKSSGIPSRTTPSLAGRTTTSRASSARERIRRGIGQEPLALLGRGGVLPVPIEQGAADVFLQPPDLLAHRRLGAVKALGGAGEAAGTHHRHEAAEQVEIEHAGPPFTKPLVKILLFNFQM